MPDQNHLADYHDAVARAECRKQVAIAEALKAHSEAVAQIMADYVVRMAQAREHFEAVKADPTHPGHDAAREMLDKLGRTDPDPRPANDALDRAIRRIEATYREEVRKLGEMQWVGNGADPR